MDFAHLHVCFDLLDIAWVLQRQLDQQSAATLALTMAFPTSWDPYFTDTMTVLDVYHFGTQHFDHHLRQLTL